MRKEKELTEMNMKMTKPFAATILAAACAFGGEPLARFGVISDVHINMTDWHRSDMLRNALKYMDAHKADGVVACGDLTQNGKIAELREFGAIWDSIFLGDRRSDGEHVEKLFIYGDHDVEPEFSPYYMQ